MMMILLLSEKLVLMSGLLKIIIAIAVSSGALLLAVLLSAVLTNFIFKAYRKTLTSNKWIKIENSGNTNSVFRLKADSQDDRLKINFLHEEKVLPKVVLYPKETNVIDDVQPVGRENRTVTTDKKATKDAKKKALDSAGKAKEKSKAGINMARQFGMLLGALGSFLPGSLGASFKEQSTAIQGTTQNVSTAVDAPEQKKRELEHIQRQTKNLGSGSKDKPRAQDNKLETATQSDSAQSLMQDEPLVSAQPGKTKKGKRQKPIQTEMVQTPMVVPGEILTLKLQISPVNVYRVGTFQYAIMSDQLSQLQSSEFETVNTSVTKEEIVIKGISNYVGAVYFLLLFIVVSLNAYWVILFLKWFIGILF